MLTVQQASDLALLVLALVVFGYVIVRLCRSDVSEKEQKEMEEDKDLY